MSELSPKLEYLKDSRILGHVRQNLGAEDENDTSKDTLIETCSPFDLFDRWLEWEGILGYTATIWDIVRDLREMEANLALMEDAMSNAVNMKTAELEPMDWYGFSCLMKETENFGGTKPEDIVDELLNMGYTDKDVKLFGLLFVIQGLHEDWLLDELGFSIRGTHAARRT